MRQKENTGKDPNLQTMIKLAIYKSIGNLLCLFTETFN